MRRLPSLSRLPLGARCRAGFSSRGLVLALAVVLTVPAIAWSVFRNGSWSSRDDGGPMMHPVERGEFIHNVTERGNVESASNVDIACKVKSRGSGGGSSRGGSSGGTAILSIVPEGYVITQEDIDNKKVLVELDSSSLEKEHIQQEIRFEASTASKIQADNKLKTAKIANQEYLHGTLPDKLLEIEIRIAEAKVDYSQAEQLEEFSERMYRKGHITALQLQKEKIEVMKARNKVKKAEMERTVLLEYTKEKETLDYEAAIKTAEAEQRKEEASFLLEKQELDEIKEQIENCTIYAEQTGQVVYANREGHHGDDSIVIEEGILIRERQVIIRLPDPKQMQVKAKINEAKISLVKKGFPATIRLDAFPDIELTGEVEEVKEYPVPTWWGVAVKEYETTIKILDTTKIDLRAGYTAEVKIRVEQLDDVLQVPVQTIIEHGAKHYCVLRDGKGFRAHEVTVGSTNDKFVVIENGLEEGQEVVLNAAAYREKKIGLPELPPEVNRKPAQRQPPGDERASERPMRRPNASQMLQQWDKDGNGQLEKDELDQIPEPKRSGLAAADANQDGVIDRSELTAAMAPPGGPGPGARPRGSRPGAQP